MVILITVLHIIPSLICQFEGAVDEIKQCWIKRLCFESKISVLGIQETMLCSTTIGMVKRFWPFSSAFDCDFVNADGRSGDRINSVVLPNYSIGYNSENLEFDAKDGDENSKIFHGIINQRRRINNIHGIMVNGEWVSDPKRIKDEAFNFYAKKFEGNLGVRSSFHSNNFSKLSEDQCKFLDADFTEAEIKNAIWDCEGDKAPGPNGFSFEFFKVFWPSIKSDLLAAIKQFEATGYIEPKCRHILDGLLIISECISWAKKTKSKLMILKVDFEKAFDSLNWDFLDETLEQMALGTKWRS
ncbi:hypothetical protein OSB04_001731 [Centaurea solstitialis]|uniref:RNA-directed DNA polymerase, eukaryota, reverse transcriptase zinc-binding domain protein n=1 Tax=Centaurea solstitialis TaxID=347529 RepID=A0AA38U390_9ASTR|nr:hypothetical protein OSB04_001731 [Centaurea solstitialis]